MYEGSKEAWEAEGQWQCSLGSRGPRGRVILGLEDYRQKGRAWRQKGRRASSCSWIFSLCKDCTVVLFKR